MRTTASLLGSVFLLGACASMNPIAPAVPLDTDQVTRLAPANWTSQVPAELMAERTGWVASFQDPQMSAMVNQALARNHTLAGTLALVDQAEALSRSARAAQLPSVDLGATGSGDFVPNAADTDTYSGSVSASWQLDLWGRLRDRAKAAKADMKAAQEDYADLSLAVAGQTASAWVDLVSAQEQVQLSHDEVNTRERSLRIVDRRYKNGVSTSLDVRLARSALATAKASLAFQEQQRSIAARRLEVLVGQYPSNSIKAKDTLPALAAMPDPGSPADMLLRRPDVRAAEARLKAAGFRVSDARKAILPSLSLSGGAGTGGGSIEDIFDFDAAVGSLVGSLTQPLFDGGSIRANIDRTNAVARQRLESYAQTVLMAWREVEDAIDSEHYLADREAALQMAAKEAEEAERLSEREYARGVGTIFELLDAQRRRISAQTQLISARAARFNNRIDLFMALGGDNKTYVAQSAQTFDEGSKS